MAHPHGIFDQLLVKVGKVAQKRKTGPQEIVAALESKYEADLQILKEIEYPNCQITDHSAQLDALEKRWARLNTEWAMVDVNVTRKKLPQKKRTDPGMRLLPFPTRTNLDSLYRLSAKLKGIDIPNPMDALSDNAGNDEPILTGGPGTVATPVVSKSTSKRRKTSTPKDRNMSPTRIPVPAASPRLSKSSSWVTKLTARVENSPTQVSKSTTEMPKSPNRSFKSPTRIAKSPTRIAKSPTRIPKSPTRIPKSPTRIPKSPSRISKSPTRIAMSPSRIPKPPSRIPAPTTQRISARLGNKTTESPTVAAFQTRSKLAHSPV